MFKLLGSLCEGYMKRIVISGLLFLFVIFQLTAYQDYFEIKVIKHPPPRNGTAHVHWCTMCGADNCYQILKETIEIIEPYFDEIHIVDNGSTDQTSTLVNLSPKITYMRIENWDGNWPRCYYDAIRYVRKGEWFVFHDSDERPSPEMLKNLQEIIRFANLSRINTFSVQGCHHSYNDMNQGSSQYYAVIANPGFTKANFLKRDDMKIAAFGGHTGFQLFKRKAMELRDLNPHFFYNHYKSRASVRLSSFAHGFMYPTTFGGLQPYADQIIQLRNELGITKMSQLYEMLYTKNIPQKILDLVSTWEHVGREPQEVWELLIRDNCEHQVQTHCDQPCCAYRVE